MQHWLAWNWTYLTWCIISSDTLVGFTYPTAKTSCEIPLKALIYSKQTAATSGTMSGVEDTCFPLSLWCLQCFWPSFCSIMPQWWHLMVLQYEAASFHLPSVSTANINTVQYTKPYNQYEVPTIPAVVISKVLLPQSNIIAAFVHSHGNLFRFALPGLPT